MENCCTGVSSCSCQNGTKCYNFFTNQLNKFSPALLKTVTVVSSLYLYLFLTILYFTQWELVHDNSRLEDDLKRRVIYGMLILFVVECFSAGLFIGGIRKDSLCLLKLHFALNIITTVVYLCLLNLTPIDELRWGWRKKTTDAEITYFIFHILRLIITFIFVWKLNQISKFGQAIPSGKFHIN